MVEDLTDKELTHKEFNDSNSKLSDVKRQNVLNNRYALAQIEESLSNDLSIKGIEFDDERVFTKQQVANIFEVDERTIDNYIANHQEELTRNGYKLVRGQKLKQFKDLAFVDENDFVSKTTINKTTQLSLFSFKAVLNLAMLITASEKAKYIRSRILDIVVDTITSRVEDRKLVNQRDSEYLFSAFQEENYRKEFTQAIDKLIDATSKYKYAQFTNMVYVAIFQENAKEYREVLNLQAKDKVRDTFYSDVLDLISSFEVGFADVLQKEFTKLNRKISVVEATDLFNEFAKNVLFKPLITKARITMASRDFSLRDAIHYKLQQYIQAMPEADYEKFLGEKSKELAKRIDESLEVYKRLKDR